jgi:hypothetical protein
MNIPSQEQLEQVTKKLAEMLRIQDWNIEISVVTGYEMNDSNSDIACWNQGYCHENIKLNYCKIYINKESSEDWYATLVHEMIHIQGAGLHHFIKKSLDEGHMDYYVDIYEQFNEKQANVFCTLYPFEKLKEDNPDIFKEEK